MKITSSERRAVAVLRKNHATTIAGNPHSEVHVARKHSAALLTLLDRIWAEPTPDPLAPARERLLSEAGCGREYVTVRASLIRDALAATEGGAS
jgi:hypothetical protein